MAKFIVEMTTKYKESSSDLVVIMGDFNVNSRPHSFPIEYLTQNPKIEVLIINCQQFYFVF